MAENSGEVFASRKQAHCRTVQGRFIKSDFVHRRVVDRMPLDDSAARALEETQSEIGRQIDLAEPERQ